MSFVSFIETLTDKLNGLNERCLQEYNTPSFTSPKSSAEMPPQAVFITILPSNGFLGIIDLSRTAQMPYIPQHTSVSRWDIFKKSIESIFYVNFETLVPIIWYSTMWFTFMWFVTSHFSGKLNQGKRKRRKVRVSEDSVVSSNVSTGGSEDGGDAPDLSTKSNDGSYSLVRQSSNLGASHIEFFDNWMPEEYTFDNSRSMGRIESHFLRGNGSSFLEENLLDDISIEDKEEIPEVVVVSNLVGDESETKQYESVKSHASAEVANTGPLMDLFESKDNVSSTGKRIVIQNTQHISSSNAEVENEENQEPGVGVKRKDNETETTVRAFSMFTDSVSKSKEPDRVSLGHLIDSFTKADKLKDYELSPSLKAVLSSGKPQDPSDYFEGDTNVYLDFDNFDVNSFSEKKFQEDINPIISENIRLFRFLVSNKYEGEDAGLAEYVKAIRSHIDYFIDRFDNPEYSTELIPLVRDLITYDEGEIVDIVIVNKFIDSLLGLTEIVPLSVINSNLVIIMCSLQVEDFITVFLGFLQEAESIVLSSFKYYLCFNRLEEKDRKLLVSIISQSAKNLDLTSDTTLGELVDICVVFRELGHSAVELNDLYSTMEEQL